MARTTSRMESSWTGPDVSTASLQKFQVYHSKYHLQHSFLAHERMFLRLDWLLVVIISDQKDPFSTWKHHLLSIGTTPFQVFLHFCVLLVSNSDRTRKKHTKSYKIDQGYNIIWLGGLLWWKKFTIYCTCGKRSKSKAWYEHHENQFLLYNFFLTTTQCLNMEAISILLDFHIIFKKKFLYL